MAEPSGSMSTHKKKRKVSSDFYSKKSIRLEIENLVCPRAPVCPIDEQKLDDYSDVQKTRCHLRVLLRIGGLKHNLHKWSSIFFKKMNKRGKTNNNSMKIFENWFVPGFLSDETFFKKKFLKRNFSGKGLPERGFWWNKITVLGRDLKLCFREKGDLDFLI